MEALLEGHPEGAAALATARSLVAHILQVLDLVENPPPPPPSPPPLFFHIPPMNGSRRQNAMLWLDLHCSLLYKSSRICFVPVSELGVHLPFETLAVKNNLSVQVVK